MIFFFFLFLKGCRYNANGGHIVGTKRTKRKANALLWVVPIEIRVCSQHFFSLARNCHQNCLCFLLIVKWASGCIYWPASIPNSEWGGIKDKMFKHCLFFFHGTFDFCREFDQTTWQISLYGHPLFRLLHFWPPLLSLFYIMIRTALSFIELLFLIIDQSAK